MIYRQMLVGVAADMETQRRGPSMVWLNNYCLLLSAEGWELRPGPAKESNEGWFGKPHHEPKTGLGLAS